MKNVKPTTDNRSMKGYLGLLGFPLSVVRFALAFVSGVRTPGAAKSQGKMSNRQPTTDQ
jgi:hypothetical protein